MRKSGRKNNELREIEIIPNFLSHLESSCLIRFGNTKVICSATLEDRVPIFIKGTGQGWVSAEYSMLPCATETRTDRESVKGKQTGRTQEIQRLIGRSLRAALDLNALGERQIKIDCDVIQADGGTRTASVCGACVALGIAIKKLRFKHNPFRHLVAAISCGILNGEVLLDLDYSEDSICDVDANFAMNENGKLIEVQATGERADFATDQLLNMVSLAREGINQIIEIQKKILLG